MVLLIDMVLCLFISNLIVGRYLECLSGLEIIPCLLKYGSFHTRFLFIQVLAPSISTCLERIYLVTVHLLNRRNLLVNFFF